MTKVNVPNISTRKTRDGADAIAMITAYDAPSAAAASDAGIDMIWSCSVTTTRFR